MEAITLPIYSSEGKEVDSIKLDAKVFDGEVNSDAIYQAINAYRANQRMGLASTKTRGEVSGGGRKPWKQKGTGRARAGSTRSPLWRHGGVVFGPHPRDFYCRIPKKIKTLALKSSLNAKLKENNFIIVDSITLANHKTKEAVKVFSNLKAAAVKNNKANKILLLLDKVDENLKLALRNVEFLNINLAKDTHVYQVMSHKKIVINKEGLSGLVNRLNPVRNTRKLTEKNKISNGVKK